MIALRVCVCVRASERESALGLRKEGVCMCVIIKGERSVVVGTGEGIGLFYFWLGVDTRAQIRAQSPSLSSNCERGHQVWLSLDLACARAMPC